ncbi:hypothetical protein CH373_03235 [Leptospira perolatii]|uniref:NADH-quinone oxidoreductase subunit D domain-containing protein n=1 Tax=Leptospira perolatii TaxID=2023191 RepID=A0A2M9ZSH5_9LEPT|nr:metal (Ni/Fe) hydrogenase large subunit [Leptospira perolatii]PJZ71514.1 hypothetical protein CH360_03230 [Leptospira perolatii]PJZ75047.1 hypothetical protein CH373_03235 [Leptospira perolatii]
MADRKSKIATGLFYPAQGTDYYVFKISQSNLFMETQKKGVSDLLNMLMDRKYPLWLLRHSLGTSELPEDYTDRDAREYLSLKREAYVSRLYKQGTLRGLKYSGLKIPILEGCYSHAVGPIHAGVIEPGHFRFVVNGEQIQNLEIRLGFQKRGILSKLVGCDPIRAMAIAETISGDSTVAYSYAFSKAFESAFQWKVSPDVELWRMVLLEVERIAVHIGDMGAIAGDIGYYPLLGVCSTDRGVPLGFMETLVGNRMGKGALYPGEVRANPKLVASDLKDIKKKLVALLRKIEIHFGKAARDSTIRERLQNCGILRTTQAYTNGVIGMACRATGMKLDLRYGQPLYSHAKEPLQLDHDPASFHGDAWSRFYLRFLEFQASSHWLLQVIETLNLDASGKGAFRVLKEKPEVKGSGPFYAGVEGWRGSNLVALLLNQNGTIKEAYIRDPSVLNWHALEIAIRGELVGDFPLNNKSFNLSYVGVDL